MSATDRDADEWNTAAARSDQARSRRPICCRRLKQRYGANGFVHFGQGKWYPGEQLPRWALGCYWRADGEPAWTDASLFADERHPDGHGAADAERFITALAAQLGVTAGHVQAGLRGRLVLPLARAPAAGQRRSVRRAARRRAGARPPAPRLHAGSRRGRRLRAADSARRRTGRIVGDGPVVPARRAAVSVSRRLADGTSAAARLAAVGCSGRPPDDRGARSVRAARGAQRRASRTGAPVNRHGIPEPVTQSRGGAGDPASGR